MKKTAWITGGSRGIGYGTAEKLLENRYNVVITGRNQEYLDQAQLELSSKYDPDAFLVLQSDVRDFSAQQKIAETIIDKYGSIDVLVANAGIGHFANIEDLTKIGRASCRERVEMSEVGVAALTSWGLGAWCRVWAW